MKISKKALILSMVIIISMTSLSLTPVIHTQSVTHCTVEVITPNFSYTLPKLELSTIDVPIIEVIEEVLAIESVTEVMDIFVPDRTFARFDIFSLHDWVNSNYTKITMIDVDPELQWLIYDYSIILAEMMSQYMTEMHEKEIVICHEFVERLLIGLFALESGVNTLCRNPAGPWDGLGQVSPFWKRSEAVAPYRLTEDHRSRDLFNPEHNILTIIEIWSYAINHHNIDLTLEDDLGFVRLLYWHNTGSGRQVNSWRYSTNILRYAELLQEYEIETEWVVFEEVTSNLEYYSNSSLIQ